MSTTTAKKTSTKGTETASFIDNNIEHFKEIEQALDIAEYYGFVPVKTPAPDKTDISIAKSFCDEAIASSDFQKHTICIDPIQRAALLRTYNAHIHEFQQPAMLFSKNTTTKKPCFNLDVIGNSKSVSEALIIKTIIAIAEEKGYSSISVRINSAGDKDSLARFEREASAFYKKHLSELPQSARLAFKKNPLSILECTNDSCLSLNSQAPQMMSFLSEPSRIHFKETLEYLETLGIDYTICNTLLGKAAIAPQTIFEVWASPTDKAEDAILIATGSRYNSLAKKVGIKKECYAIGATVMFDKVPKEKKFAYKKKKHKFFFIQFGADAKFRSLRVIDALQKARVPVLHAVTKDKLGAQMATAENLEIPYVLIMGQKEALENSVVVRDMTTRSQQSIPLSELGTHLKKLK